MRRAVAQLRPSWSGNLTRFVVNGPAIRKIGDEAVQNMNTRTNLQQPVTYRRTPTLTPDAAFADRYTRSVAFTKSDAFAL